VNERVRASQRAAVEAIGVHLGVSPSALEQWYRVSHRQFIAAGGRSLLAAHRNSLALLLATVFPEYRWMPLKFAKAPRHAKQSLVDQRVILNELAPLLGVSEGDWTAWYHVSGTRLAEVGGRRLLSYYGGSLHALLTAVYPEHAWDPQRFDRTPQRYWTQHENQRSFLATVGEALGCRGPDREWERWYTVSAKEIRERGGGRLLSLYGNSMSRLLAAVYPEHAWQPDRFKHAPARLWHSLDRQRAALETLAPRLGVTSDRSSWYSVTSAHLVAAGGAALLAQHGSSLSRLLAALYPDYPWQPLRFRKAPQRYWESREHQRSFLDGVAAALGMSEGAREPWYTVMAKTLLAHGGRGLLARYGNSMPALLAAVYDDYAWQAWRFPQLRPRDKRRHEDKVKPVEEALSEAEVAQVTAIESALGLKSPEEWRRVTRQEVAALDLASLTKRHLFALLRRRYPTLPLFAIRTKRVRLTGDAAS